MSKILFIEDDGNYGYVVRTRLTRMGHEVVVTCDGEEGLAQARAVKPDPVLMDLSLPVMDGWEATRQLKAAPETAYIPIIVLSAHAMLGVRDQALESGAIDNQSKPIRIQELPRKIDRAFAR